MLLGVAQLVVNRHGLERERAALLRAGFTETFTASEIPNHPGKRVLQAEPRTTLEMAHFSAGGGGVAVEVTAYSGAPPSGRAAYRLELPEGEGGARVSLPASEYVASLEFWCDGLGFRHEGDGALVFPAIRKEWAVDVELEAGADDGPSSVDADGCVLVTMLTTGLDADFASLRERFPGSRSAPPWDELIDGRTVRVAMIEGPSGELIELLQPPRER